MMSRAVLSISAIFLPGVQKASALSLPNVDSVDYNDSEAYNKGNHTLFVISTSFEYNSPEEKAIKKSLEQDFEDYTLVFRNDNPGSEMIPFWLLAVAVGLLFLILFLMCKSWFEPLLFLVNIGFAVIINEGSNIILGEIADVTSSMAAILQLVLSIDYSIMLLNRYRQEKVNGLPRTDAMVAAITNCFSSVAGSALTTAAGLFALVFMKFKIGMDLGIVTAKGVLISFVCVFTILPGLVLFFDSVIEKTEKKAMHFSMGKIARFCYRFRYALSGLFVVLFITFYFLQGNTEIAFTLTKVDHIVDVFPPQNPMVVVYETRDEEKIGALGDTLEGMDGITQVMSYPTMLGKPYKAEELGDALSSLAGSMGFESVSGYTSDNGADSDYSSESDAGIKSDAGTESDAGIKSDAGTESNTGFDLNGGFDLDPAFLKLIYYDYYDGSVDSVTLMDVLQLSATMSGSEGSLTDLLNGESDLFPGSVRPEDMRDVLFLYCAAEKNYDPSWTLTVHQFFNYLHDSVLNDERFKPFMTEEIRKTITDTAEMLDMGVKMLRGDTWSRMIINTTLPVESDATDEFLNVLTKAGEGLEGDYYLIGNSAMSNEMKNSFGKELFTITLLTAAAIFLIVLITSRSIVVPVILVLIVQCGVYITVTVVGLQGYSIYFLALLIVECILMGATIDYGILITSYYREKRKELPSLEALVAACNNSIHTVMTSGLIIVLITGILGYTYSDPTVAEICRTISTGSLSAILLILFILPGMLATFDRFL